MGYGKSALVIGDGSKLASFTAAHLLEEGHQVTLIHNSRKNIENPYLTQTSAVIHHCDQTKGGGGLEQQRFLKLVEQEAKGKQLVLDASASALPPEGPVDRYGPRDLRMGL